MAATSQTCLQLNGTSDYMEVPYAADLNPNQFTVSFWAKVDGRQGHWRSPLSCRNFGSKTGYILYAADDNKWQCWLGNGSDWIGDIGMDVQLGVWTHLATTFNGSQIKLYINGNPAISKNASLAINTTHPLQIGKGEGWLGTQFFFPGKIAEVRVWNVVRTQSDITTTMNQRLVGSETGLVGYWKLDGTANDSQTNGTANNGTLHGGNWVSDPDLNLADVEPPAPAPVEPSAPPSNGTVASPSSSSGTDPGASTKTNASPQMSGESGSAIEGEDINRVVAAILTDLAAAQYRANQFSSQLGRKYQGDCQVPNIVLRKMELDLKFALEKIVKNSPGVPSANVIVDLNALQNLPPKFISSLKLQAELDRYGVRTTKIC